MCLYMYVNTHMHTHTHKHIYAHTYTPMHACVPSRFIHVRLFATVWTVACQVPLSMGFSSQKYWSGLSCPSPGDLPNPCIDSASLTSCLLHWQAGSLPLAPPRKPSPIHICIPFHCSSHHRIICYCK